MANQISKYLRNAGVKTPEQMTEAQIGEQNKSNPLSSFGFMSAQQKQRRQLEEAMAQKQMDQEQQMLQQQLIARMSSEEKIGHYAGSGLMGLMQHLKSKGQAPEMAPQAPQNDPQVDRYNQLAMEVGPEMAMQILGQEQGNASMVQQGQEMRTARDKEALEAKYKQSQIQNMESQMADRAEVKPNNTVTVQRTGPDGKPMQASLEVVGKDPKTGLNIYRELGQAVKGSVTGTKEQWETSKGGINERTKSMENALTSTANAIDSYDALDKLIKDTPAGGWAGALVGKADDIMSGVKNLGTIIAESEGRDIKASMDLGDYDFTKMEKFAGGAAKIKSLVLELAYARAAATGDSSRSLSDRDVQNQIDIVGGQISNPKIFGELMQQNKELMVKKLENMGKYTKIDGKSIGEAYGSDIAELRNRVGGGGTQTAKLPDGMSEEAAIKRLEELRKKHKK